MWETPHIPVPDKPSSCLAQLLIDTHMTTMTLLRRWCILLAELLLFWVSAWSSSPKRRCVFQVKPQNMNYTVAGNVSGSVQECEHTRCCVGYYLVRNGRLEVDFLACDVLEKFCPDPVCQAQSRFNSRVLKCVCSTDLCNRNISWAAESQQPGRNKSNSADQLIMVMTFVAAATALILLLLVFKWERLQHSKATRSPSLVESHVSNLCSCQTTASEHVDVADVQLQQVISQGRFAALWRATYRGTTVAVKVFPATWKQKFTAEKEVYELPLMKHAAITQLLGAGRRPHSSDWILILDFHQHGSLHSFLDRQIISWATSLKLSQSLSQGLCFLHTDLFTHELHKPPVAHRDLSSFNVLVGADTSCVLADFGCSKVLRSWSGRHQKWDPTGSSEEEGMLGTLCYMSPEILDGSVNLHSASWTLQADIYSLGLLLWEIWSCCSELEQGGFVLRHALPYERELGAAATRETLAWYVSHMKKRPPLLPHWEHLPQGSLLRDTVEECWDCDADARLTAACVADRLASIPPRPLK